MHLVCSSQGGISTSGTLKFMSPYIMFQGASLTDGDGQGNFDQLPQQSLDDMLQGKTTANISFYDDTALCTAAYRIMKSMLNSWLGEVVSYENPLAAEQIEHFHR